ncbi:MAG: hypothetical protein ACI8V2_001186 [Candidatus Latescibacterota bacterium]|jgi:hypothetical protein
MVGLIIQKRLLLFMPAARSFLEHPRKEPKEGCHCVGL